MESGSDGLVLKALQLPTFEIELYSFAPVKLQYRVFLYVVRHWPSLSSGNSKYEKRNSNDVGALCCFEHSIFGIGICLVFRASKLGFEVVDCIFEYMETITFLGYVLAGVLWMLDVREKPFRMGHEP